MERVLAEPKEALELGDLKSKLAALERERSKLSRELTIMDLDTLRYNQSPETLMPPLASSAKLVPNVGLALAV